MVRYGHLEGEWFNWFNMKFDKDTGLQELYFVVDSRVFAYVCVCSRRFKIQL